MDKSLSSSQFLHIFAPYALRMQPYAVVMHFLFASKKLVGSRPESACREPYALYAPLLGVGPFLASFLLREVHTVHKTAYAIGFNQALALLPVGVEGKTARRNQKCIRQCIRISTPKSPYRVSTARHRDAVPAGRAPASIPTKPSNAPVGRLKAPLTGFPPKCQRLIVPSEKARGSAVWRPCRPSPPRPPPCRALERRCE